MGITNFNRKQCIKALKRLGFTESLSRRGNHDKFLPPKQLNIKAGQPPFIMVPRHKDLHCQSAILKELKAMGGDQLTQAFLDNL